MNLKKKKFVKCNFKSFKAQKKSLIFTLEMSVLTMKLFFFFLKVNCCIIILDKNSFYSIIIHFTNKKI